MPIILRYLLANTLRAVQTVLSILNLGLAAGLISLYDGYYAKGVYALVISALDLIHLALIFAPALLSFVVPFAMIIIEAIFFVLYLVAFALLANDIGTMDCSGAFYSFNWCRVGKALTGFLFISWFATFVAIVTMSLFTIVPLSTSEGGVKKLFMFGTFAHAGIFTVTPEVTDAEKNEEIEPKDEEPIGSDDSAVDAVDAVDATNSSEVAAPEADLVDPTIDITNDEQADESVLDPNNVV